MIVTYQPMLVLLSIAVAILGSLTALALTSLSDVEDTTAGQRTFALASGGLIMGATIWSMHFVAMMAVDFPVLVTYNSAETISSIGIAIVATAAGLYLASTRRLGILSIPVGGLMMGLGIAGMHYLGMAAIRGCGLDYDRNLVTASVVIAVVASMAALWFAFTHRNVILSMLGGVVQGLAIASMHYTGMMATHYVLVPTALIPNTQPFPQVLLAWAIAFGIMILALTNFTLITLLSMQRSRSA